jgi:hypothetical protein
MAFTCVRAVGVFLAIPLSANVVRAVAGNWRDGFEFAYMQPDPEPEGPGLVWRETDPDYW